MNQPTPIYPHALKQGDKIGIVAPSSHYDAPLLNDAKKLFENKGFELVFHPQTKERYGQFAGTPAQRAEAIHDYFKDDSIKAIFCLSGGNGAIHLLDLLDYGLIKANPKVFIGFSDATILLNAISAKTGLTTFQGPSFARAVKIEPQWQEQMFATLMGQSSEIKINSNENFTGMLYGGCLSPFQALLGTPYAPDMDKAVLMLEDINDHLSRYDRMIGHMKQAGCFKNLSGIILGEFLNALDNEERPFGFTIDQIVANSAPNTPLVTNAPFGHGDNLCTLPIGAEITLKNDKLSFKELA